MFLAFVTIKYSIVINYNICVGTLLVLLTTEFQSLAQHNRGRGSLPEPGVLSDLPESLAYEIFTSPLNIFLLGVRMCSPHDQMYCRWLDSCH
ncbi:hypothetical protein E2C01_100800 [Portunus trituberculatus]|uniref:Uncharacterized protein n=1 Tax=Portunus trituberculatus TaxID=210409 RepID=A0A5B7KDY8_PORTR|nr:hypothetical protein [Portunus trituberculatus]